MNTGDDGFTFSMTQQSDPASVGNAIVWRKDGGAQISAQEGLLDFSLPGQIQSSDEGIYEIHYNTERNQGRGALYRIIVRGNFFVLFK